MQGDPGDLSAVAVGGSDIDGRLVGRGIQRIALKAAFEQLASGADTAPTARQPHDDRVDVNGSKHDHHHASKVVTAALR